MVAAIRRTTGRSCIPTVTGRSIANRLTWHNRVPHGAFERLERHAGKLARVVLRGLDGSNPVRLPGALQALQDIEPRQRPPGLLDQPAIAPSAYIDHGEAQ